MIKINLRPSVRPDVLVAADMAIAKALSGPNWLNERLKKRAVGRKHKPGRDYVAMKAALATRDAELQKEEEETNDETTNKVETSKTSKSVY